MSIDGPKLSEPTIRPQRRKAGTYSSQFCGLLDSTMAPTDADSLDSIFGRLDPALPTLIGKIVMLAALLEHKVAVLASSVQDLPQAHYFAQDFSRNREDCRQRFRFFTQSSEISAVTEATCFINSVAGALDMRNQIVHRVWARAESEPWGGHKAHRGTNSALDSNWRDYTRQDLREVLQLLATLADQSSEIVSRVAALPRLPTPYRFAVPRH